MVIVQRSVALVPGGTPVTPDVAEEVVVIVAVPLTTVQVPVPVAGTLPASVNAPLLHCVWSGPAAAVVGAADTVPVPVAVVCVVALVVLALILPLAPFVASDFNRTYIVTPLTVVPVRVTVSEEAKPVPLDREISYPVGALTVTSASRLDPFRVSVWVAEAVPAQVLKGDNVPDSVIDGADPTVTVTFAVF